MTPEQSQALNSSEGMIHGDYYILMKKSFFIEWIGLNDEVLFRELNIGFENAERDEFVNWNPDEIKATGRQLLNKQTDTP